MRAELVERRDERAARGDPAHCDRGGHPDARAKSPASPGACQAGGDPQGEGQRSEGARWRSASGRATAASSAPACGRGRGSLSAISLRTAVGHLDPGVGWNARRDAIAAAIDARSARAVAWHRADAPGTGLALPLRIAGHAAGARVAVLSAGHRAAGTRRRDGSGRWRPRLQARGLIAALAGPTHSVAARAVHAVPRVALGVGGARRAVRVVLPGPGQGYAAAVATEHHDARAFRVVRHGDLVAHRGTVRAADLRPRGAVPLPCVGQLWAARVAPEHHRLAGHGVEGHPELGARRRGDARRLCANLGPGSSGAVPGPDVAEVGGGSAAGAPEEHRHVADRVEDHACPVASRRAGGRRTGLPDGTVPRPGVGQGARAAVATDIAGLDGAAEEHGSPTACIEVHRRLRANGRRCTPRRAKRRPRLAVPRPGVVLLHAGHAATEQDGDCVHRVERHRGARTGGRRGLAAGGGQALLRPRLAVPLPRVAEGCCRLAPEENRDASLAVEGHRALHAGRRLGRRQLALPERRLDGRIEQRRERQAGRVVADHETPPHVAHVGVDLGPRGIEHERSGRVQLRLPRGVEPQEPAAAVVARARDACWQCDAPGKLGRCARVA